MQRRVATLADSDTGAAGPTRLAAPDALRTRWRLPAVHGGDPLFRSAYALILSTAATSAFGIAYWIVAARAYPRQILGEQSAAISTMLMLSNFAQMNLFFALGRFVPTAGRSTARLIAAAYAASAALGLVLGAGFVALAPSISSDLAPLVAGPAMAAAFVLGVALWSLFSLQDGVLTALRRAPWVPIENALFGLVKLALLLLFAGVFVSGGIFASWTVPVLLAVIPVNLLIFRRLIARPTDGHGARSRFSARSVAHFVALDYVSSVFLQSYTTALPLLIVATLGAQANADFYVAYVVIAALDLVSVNLATSLLVEGAHDERRLTEYTRRILRRSVQLLLPAVLLIELVAPWFTRLLGHDYADGSTTLLRILALASLARMVNIVYMATMRVQRRVGRVVATQAAISALVLSLALALGPSMGVEGVGVAWLSAQLAVAVALTPWLRRTLGRAR
jgi:O-antigen/teichoic acid export membrane protein